MFCRLFSFLLLISSYTNAQSKTDGFLVNLLNKDTNTILKKVLANKDVHRLQIIYTVIDRDKKNRPTFRNYYFNYDPGLYFNPASIVKLPLAILSLEKLNELKKYHLHAYSTVYFDSSRSWHKPLAKDTTSRDGKPTIAHFIKRAFLISENDPYNRMYQFLGQETINRKLHEKGYKDARITRQFMGLTPDQNRITNPLHFIHTFGDILYVQPEQVNHDSFDFSRQILIGKAHWNSRDSVVNQPFDFTRHNNLSLETVQQMLQSVMFPASVPEKQRFNLTDHDRKFLYQYLSQFPSETPDPKYDTSKFYDSYVKFFFRNSNHKLPQGVRVFNKVGWSYGFLTDVSYVADFNNRIEFMLSVTLYVNSDEILNDGKYEYNSIGYPFLYQLGQAIYQHELNRRRKYKPDLSDFKINYETRDPNDKRPSLKEVDN
jgi:hypothetical protein